MLSAQHLVSCDIRGQQSCNGGYLDRAWSYIRKFGLVDEQCFPYTASNEKCKVLRKGGLAEAKCKLPELVDRKSKYKVAPAYRIGNETDIMHDIMTSGPVQGKKLEVKYCAKIRLEGPNSIIRFLSFPD
jgi:hypothetical protein